MAKSTNTSAWSSRIGITAVRAIAFICNLGRKELLAPHAEALLRLLQGKEKTKAANPEARAVGAWDWGVLLVARHFWQQLGLQAILDALAKHRGLGRELADRALALVSNRLCEPTSEHGMARWLETDFVCDRWGRRWLPEWREEEERLSSQRPRVRVQDRQLRLWYRTLDQLLVQQKQIEKELFLRLRNLFSFNVDLVFYDLTSTYFEGNGPVGLARHGHSRDGKPRNRQVLVGLVMIEGWPIAHQWSRATGEIARPWSKCCKTCKRASVCGGWFLWATEAW